MIYVNNSATSFPKPDEVVRKTISFLSKPFIDTGRSRYTDVGLIEDCRENLADFFGIKNKNRVIYTSGATEALNIAIRGLHFNRDDIVVSTSIEHNSIIRPLKHLEREKGIRPVFVDCNEYGYVDKEVLFGSVSDNTRCIIINHCSNVTGALLNIREICREAKKRKIISIVDCSQSAGSVEIDATDVMADILVFTGHKNLFGYPGIGGLYVKENVQLKPLKTGGTGIKSENIFQPEEYPLYLEAGTKNILGIVSLNEGIEYIRRTGIKSIRQHKLELTSYLFDKLKTLDKLTVYSNMTNCEGIISFTMAGYSPDEIGKIMEVNYDIVTRTGLHCAPLIHRNLGTDKIGGTVRISLSHFNTIKEMDAVFDCLRLL